MFLKNKNNIFKVRRSKVTDYAALTKSIIIAILKGNKGKNAFQEVFPKIFTEVIWPTIDIVLLIACRRPACANGQPRHSPKGFTLTLQETRIIHDSMNLPKIEFIAYIYILLLITNI